MSTASRVLDIARGHIGYIEGPRNNETVFGARSGYNFQPWCGSFTDAVLQDAGLQVTKSGGPTSEPSSVYTPSGSSRYKSIGRWIPRHGAVQPGDIVYFDWGGSESTSRVDHVGIVEAVLPDGRIQTIEGNTSRTDSGSQGNGGGVWRRVRSRGVIAGFGRPLYTPDNNNPYNPNSNIDWLKLRKFIAAVLQNEIRPIGTLRKGSRGAQVASLQKALNLITGSALVVDGDFGNATHSAVVSFQKFFKLAGDGIVGPKTKGMLLICLEKIKTS